MTIKDMPHRDAPLLCAAPPETCATAAFVLSLLGDKWSLKVMVKLGTGPLRFNELKRLVTDISQRMLTATLRNLEREGMVLRTAHPGKHPAVEYRLSDLGRSLWAAVYPLGEWTSKHLHEIGAARERFDRCR